MRSPLRRLLSPPVALPTAALALFFCGVLWAARRLWATNPTLEYCLDLQELFCDTIANALSDPPPDAASVGQCATAPISVGSCSSVQQCSKIIPPVAGATPDCCLKFGTQAHNVCQELFLPTAVSACCIDLFGGKRAECIFPCLSGAPTRRPSAPSPCNCGLWTALFSPPRRVHPSPSVSPRPRHTLWPLAARTVPLHAMTVNVHLG